MKRLSLILVLCIIMSTFYGTSAFAGTEETVFPYSNEFESQLTSDNPLIIKPVNNKPQASIIISDKDSALIFRGGGDTSWTATTSHVRLWLGEIPGKPRLVYEVKIKGKNFAANANINYRTDNNVTPLFYMDSSGNIYDKKDGNLITTIDDFTIWHTIHIIYDNEADEDGKYYRTIYVDGMEYPSSRAEGNKYAETGEFKASPSANLQTNGTVGDRMVYYDYIRVYEYPDDFKAELMVSDALDKVNFNFSFAVNEDTLEKEKITFVSDDASHTVGVDSVKMISADKYEMTLEEKLNFNTVYNVIATGVESITGMSLSEISPVITRVAKSQIDEILISENKNIISGNQTIDISYTNETKSDFSGRLFYAQYKDDGTLISIDEADITLNKEKEETIHANIIIDSDTASMQVYVKNSDGADFSGAYTFFKTGDIFFAPLKTPENTISHSSSYVIDENTGEITVTVTTEEETTVTLQVKKADEVIYALRLNTEDKKAYFKFTPYEEGETYVYSYTVNKGLTDGSEEFVYYTPGYIMSSFKTFNSTEDISVAADFLDKMGAPLDINLDTYNSYPDEATDKETVLKSLIAQRKQIEPDKEYADITAVNNALEVAYKLISLKNGEITVEDMKESLSADTYTYYNDNMTSAVKSKIAASFKNKEILTLSELDKLFKDTMIFEAIENGENYKLTTDIIANYHEYIGLDLRIYSTLKDTYKVDSIIHGNEYESFQLLEDAFNKAVAERKKAENNKKPSGGGGGGGGSGPVIDFTPKAEKADKPVQETPAPETVSYFTDLSSYGWAEAAINKLAKAGVISGKSNGVYAPQDTVTRAELVKMIIEAFAIEKKTGKVSFSDLSDSHWSYSYVVTACENNLLKGIDENTFNTDGAVTREMAATVLYRVCKFKNISLSEGVKEFSDNAEVSDYARDAVSILGANSVINGYTDGSFKPKGNVTRAEIAVLINNLIK